MSPMHVRPDGKRTGGPPIHDRRNTSSGGTSPHSCRHRAQHAVQHGADLLRLGIEVDHLIEALPRLPADPLGKVLVLDQPPHQRYELAVTAAVDVKGRDTIL